MTGGWQAQLRRLERWHSRITNATTFEDKEDFVYAFFINGLSLRDWLIDTDAVEKSIVDSLFESNRDMKLCRDLANEFKHYSLRRPSNEHPPSLQRSYVSGAKNDADKWSIIVISNGELYDVVSLAGRVLRTWQYFTERFTGERGISKDSL